MPHQELYSTLFGKHEKGDPVEHLKKLTDQYPYFSLPHFFLLKHLRPSDPAYGKIAGKTALHFNNPHFLQYQLKKEKDAGIVAEKQDEQINDLVFPVEINPGEVEVLSGSPEYTNETVLPDVNATKEIAENTNTPETVKNKQPQGDKDLVFEPLFTTDYFASQGIKLSENVQSADKLGKQLKSFTEWLKTMKNVPGKVTEAGAPAIDLTVQNLAEKSNKEQEVITEAMAEVYIQQGKTSKAADVYHKLSLQYPAKSAYFAAKIERLKAE